MERLVCWIFVFLCHAVLVRLRDGLYFVPVARGQQRCFEVSLLVKEEEQDDQVAVIYGIGTEKENQTMWCKNLTLYF